MLTDARVTFRVKYGWGEPAEEATLAIAQKHGGTLKYTDEDSPTQFKGRFTFPTEAACAAFQKELEADPDFTKMNGAMRLLHTDAR